MDPHNDIVLTDLPTQLESNIAPDCEQQQHPVDHANQREFSLPPADGGKDAWLYLAAAFVVEALTWGSLQQFFLDSH